ncbi:hypothetical protein FQN54_007024 [Arachnomyces sp. PD_36]|nr:hypothetical protein FQN54_007024 [Arachnomyces sp. PD_36]
MSQSPPNPKKRVVNTKQKRIQIDDNDGWTHITTSNKNSRTKKTKNSNSKKNTKTPAFNDLLRPAEPPGHLTFQGLEEQFHLHQRRWEESQCRGTVKWGLERALLGNGRASHPSLKDSGTITHAQDPVFNNLDKKLLSSLNIQVINDPAAFDLVDENTFLYCPGAERSHLVDLLKRDPALFFGGPLEEGGRGGLLLNENGNEEEAVVLSKFTQTRDSVQLPAFEPDEHAFWNMRLYWKREDD